MCRCDGFCDDEQERSWRQKKSVRHDFRGLVRSPFLSDSEERETGLTPKIDMSSGSRVLRIRMTAIKIKIKAIIVTEGSLSQRRLFLFTRRKTNTQTDYDNMTEKPNLWVITCKPTSEKMSDTTHECSCYEELDPEECKSGLRHGCCCSVTYDVANCRAEDHECICDEDDEDDCRAPKHDCICYKGEENCRALGHQCICEEDCRKNNPEIICRSLKVPWID